MKTIKLLTTLLGVLIATATFAQDIPKKEFTVSITDKNIQVSPGQTKEYSVTLNRSKSYQKIDIDLGINSVLPEGVSVSFKDGENPKTDRIMVISAEPDAQPFQKTIILNATSSRVSKGIMMNMSLDGKSLSSN